MAFPRIILLITALIINVFGKYSTVFDGVWIFEHEGRDFQAYICAKDEENIYLGMDEIWYDENGDNHHYTIGVSYFGKISESDSKLVIASSKSYVLAKRDDRNKNGYFESIFVLQYKKEENAIYIHFKLTKRASPTNIKLRKKEEDEFDENLNDYTCMVPPDKRDIKKIDGIYPQIWKAFGYKFHDEDKYIVSRMKQKLGCWGWLDIDGNIKQSQGGYFSSIQYQYDDNLMLFKWYDVGNKYSKEDDCKSGSGMFMIMGKWENRFVARFSYQCDDGKTGYSMLLELWMGLKDEIKYQCPLLTPQKTDL